jgi:hypothetical protein
MGRPGPQAWKRRCLVDTGLGIPVGGVHDMLSRAILVDGKAGDRKCYE